jgi:hypothetical protein
MDGARHVIGCHSTQESWVQYWNHDVASTIHQSLIQGGYVISLALTYPLIFCTTRDVLVELAVVKVGPNDFGSQHYMMPFDF